MATATISIDVETELAAARGIAALEDAAGQRIVSITVGGGEPIRLDRQWSHATPELTRLWAEVAAAVFEAP